MRDVYLYYVPNFTHVFSVSVCWRSATETQKLRGSGEDNQHMIQQFWWNILNTKLN